MLLATKTDIAERLRPHFPEAARQVALFNPPAGGWLRQITVVGTGWWGGGADVFADECEGGDAA
jgi:hypothetical protein